MGTILVVYYSGSGNTKQMAERVAEGAAADKRHAVKVVPVTELDMNEFAAAAGYALGSPDYFTYMAGQMKTFFDRALVSVVKNVKDKPFVSFVSHGGGGGAIESLDRLGKAVGLNRVCEGVKSKGPPSKTVAEECRELGRKLADAAG
jgi:multimeric flavodoxin WrbA